MTPPDQNSKFRPRARLLLQLGDQLIRNENIAVVELVKNAYDADATTCDVAFVDIDNSSKGEIRITDNGIGMTPDIINKVWLEPGADFKEAILDGNQARFDFAITIPKRVPIGEKGVGRFGAHKLGDYIELVTKSADSEAEVVIEIDWQKFSEETYLDEAQFVVRERKPERFVNGQTGTTISIKKLRKDWDEKLYRELRRNLLALSSPFSSRDDFQVTTNLKLRDATKEVAWNDKLISLDDIREKALWHLSCEIEGSAIKKFAFKFTPWPTMDKLEPRELEVDDLASNKLLYKKGTSEALVDLDQFKIGPVKLEAYLFDLDAKILRLGFQDVGMPKEYMAQNGGVKVYRDDMRVYDYGEQDDDWLSLDKSRINEPVKKIGNRNILAAVMLDRRSSGDLREKTNREGFVENDAFFAFRQAINIVIDIFAQNRNVDKEHIRKYYEGSTKTQPVLHDIDELKDVIESGLQDVEFADKQKFTTEVFSNLDRIKDQYVETNRVLLKNAGAGLSLSVVIHEIDKRIKELVSVVEGESFDQNRVRTIIQSIARLVDNYSVLVANDKKKHVSVKSIIDDALFGSEFRLKAHKVTVVKGYDQADDARINCSINMIIGILFNIFDNAIYWLHTREIKDKKIYIDIRHYPNGEVGLLVADNGKGLTVDFEDAVQPFVTTRSGGIGLGLHIANEMMKVHQGRFVSRGYKETEGIPEEFKDGAILELIFKAEDETERSGKL